MRVVSLCALLLAIAQGAHTQTAWTLLGILLDPSDRPVPAVAITLVQSGSRWTTHTTESGEFRFPQTPPGECELTAIVPGFDPVTYTISGAEPPTAEIILRLYVSQLKQELEVPSEPSGLTVGASGNRDAISVERGLLNSLPVLDLDYLAALARFLDPSTAAAGGPSLIVDGMESRNIGVTPSAIQEIKFNQNPYTAEYPRWSRRRVEVTTKTAAELYHGMLNFVGRDYRLNARDAFAVERPPEHRRAYEGSIIGPVGSGERSSFLLAGLHEDEDPQYVVFAAGPEGPVHENVHSPARNTQLSLRVSRQFSERQHAFWQANYQDRKIINQGVGGTVLPEAGTEYRFNENEFIFNHRIVFSTSRLSQFRVLLGRHHAPITSIVDRPKIVISGAFTGGGAQADALRTEVHTSIAWILTHTSGAHTVKYGINVPDWSRRGFSDRSDRLGTYYFASLDEYRLASPYAAVVQRGEPRIVFIEKVLGGFLQDEWQVRSGLSISAGLRYDWQNYFDDANNFSPRLALAWAPRKQPKFVIRGGAGVFYDRSGPAPIADILRLDGTHLDRYVVTEGSAFPLSDDALNGAAPARVRQGSVHPPYTVQFSLGLERQLTQDATLAVNYVGTRGVRQFRSRDANAPLPPLFAGRPDPRIGVLRVIEPAGRVAGNALEVTLRTKPGKRVSGLAQYSFGRVMSDVGGLNWFPANSFDPAGEWGRADTDRRHQFHALGTVALHEWFHLGVTASISSGAPFNITTGRDDNRDGVALDRPPGTHRNTGQGPGYAAFDVRWFREFRWKVAPSEQPRSFTISVDAFNLFNRVNYIAIAGALSSPLFGMPVAAHPPRRFQLGLRYQF